MQTKQKIGRQERIAFPDLNLKNIKAKIDSGAYSSALHCKILKTIKTADQIFVTFIPLVYKNKLKNAVPIQLPVIAYKTVRSSNGALQKRMVVQLKVTLGKQTFMADFTLTDRSAMRYTILLGRKFLSKRFVIDVSKRNLLPDITK